MAEWDARYSSWKPGSDGRYTEWLSVSVQWHAAPCLYSVYSDGDWRVSCWTGALLNIRLLLDVRLTD